MVGQNDDDNRRYSINLRVDVDKYAMLEQLRTTGFGISKTERNRSDVYNEILGFGLQVHLIRAELGDRDFQRFWEIIHNLNLRGLNLEGVERLLVGKKGK
jgi:hypothetical protein